MAFFLQKQRILGCVLFMALPACSFELAGPLELLDNALQESPGVHCSFGGERQLSGFDVNRNGELDDFEIRTETYVCLAKNSILDLALPEETSCDVSITADNRYKVTCSDGKELYLDVDIFQVFGPQVQLAVGLLPVGSVCLNGGYHVAVGRDDNMDALLQSQEVQGEFFFCHGQDGLDGADGADGDADVMEVFLEEPGPYCPYGGQRIVRGQDIDANSVLSESEILGTTYICNAAPGEDGTTGLDGEDYDGVDASELIVLVELEPSGPHCANGGQVIHLGLDHNADGEIDFFLGNATYVCDGEDALDGENGVSSDIFVESLSAGAGGCNGHGGWRITIQNDTNENGYVEDEEITYQVICFGEEGDTGQIGVSGSDAADLLVVSYTDDNSDQCSLGAVTISWGLDVNGDGSLSNDEIQDSVAICHISFEDLYLAQTGLAGMPLTQVNYVPPENSPQCDGEQGGNGGWVQFLEGYDANANGVLEASEIEAGYGVCNILPTFELCPDGEVTTAQEGQLCVKSSSDLDGSVAEIAWESLPGALPVVELVNADSASPSFVAPGIYTSEVLDDDELLVITGTEESVVAADADLRLEFQATVYDNFGAAVQKNMFAEVLPPTYRASQLVLGKYHSCALLDNDNLHCFGSLFGGKLGDDGVLANVGPVLGDAPGEMPEYLVSVKLGIGDRALSLIAGESVTCVINDSAEVQCWGSDVYSDGLLGQDEVIRKIGDGENRVRDYHIDLGEDLEVLDLSAGKRFFCALVDGEHLQKAVKCWGSNAGLVLGLGGGPGLRIGDGLDADGNFVLDETGACLLDADGESLCEMGEGLAAVDLGSQYYPAEIESGKEHTCARSEEGEVKCWGRNDKGQCGIDSASNYVGISASDLGDNLASVDFGDGCWANKIALGAKHSCALIQCTDNEALEMKCWGSNEYGQLGQGSWMNAYGGDQDYIYDLPPISLGTDLAPVDVFAGEDSACALLDNEELKCWGKNYSGEIGDSTSSEIGDQAYEMGDNLVPLDFGASGVRDIVFSCSSETTCRACALLDEGEIKCWSKNRATSSYLGLGVTTAQPFVPGDNSIVDFGRYFRPLE